MKQKGLAPILIIVLIALVATGVYFLGTKNILKLPAFFPIPALSPTPDPTANWKKYTNTKYNFSFKYPPDLAVQEAQNSIYYEVVLRDKNQVPVLDILISQNNSLPIDTFQSQGSKTIGAIIWQVYYSPKIVGGPDPSKNVDELQLRRQQNGYWFILRFYGQKELAETQTQILSTFKFSASTSQASYPTIVFLPPLSNIDRGNDRDIITARVINPFIDFQKDLDPNQIIVSITIEDNVEVSSKNQYPFKFTAILKNGSTTQLLLGQTSGVLNWYEPTCMGCKLTPQFVQKYPEIAKQFDKVYGSQ